ncbi:TerD family protein [Ruminococcus sp.]|uniref:TerD family protein n=1 Tax=Ruminococcus sp. TaxID=41978 RepID=UPI0025D56AFF|nr:TerD family protein [Ruminococcus sp.]
MKNFKLTELDKILLRRKHSVMFEPANMTYEQSKTEKALVVSGLKNVQALGFTFSKELIEKAFHFTRDEFTAFYGFLIPALKELVGADVTYNPMYPNFPQQVAEASDIELFINAIVHYWSFGTLIPEYEKNERLPLIDDNKMAVLSVGSHDDLMTIFTNLVESKTSISEQDKEDIETIILACPDYTTYLPDTIPLKENVAFVGKLIIEKAPIKSADSIGKYFKTATDVLRLVTALSDGDISLASKTKYRNLRRVERRMIMDLLTGCGNITEDLFRYQYEWIRVAEILHPFEYKKAKYSNVNAAFNTLRNEKKPLMFAGKVQAAITAKDMREAATLLKVRPGEFARQLDKLIRDADNPNYIVNCFKEVATEISTPVLLQVRQHFIGRMENDNQPVRVFFPKGNLAKAMVIRNELPKINSNVCKNVARICREALIEQYKEKDFLGKVYIDEDFKNYLVPFSQRSASKAVKTIVRGSKLPIKEDATAVRGFIWWTNTDKTRNSWDKDRVDIDLSATIYDENWQYVDRVSYTQLRSAKYRAYHSGDITNGGNVNGDGVAEFIDVEIDAVAKNTGRYIAFQVYSFTGQHFSTLPNCRFGWMEREDVNSGEIFEPQTVEMKIDLTADSTVAIPVIFDCVERKFIWCDMNLQNASSRFYGNNLESNLHGVTATCYGLTHLNKANIYDLIMMNAIARGSIVTDRNEADIIFSNDTTVPYEIVNELDEVTGTTKPVVKEKPEVSIITAFDTDYFMSQLL